MGTVFMCIYSTAGFPRFFVWVFDEKNVILFSKGDKPILKAVLHLKIDVKFDRFD